MVGLVDIAPVTKSVVIRGEAIKVMGVSARGVALLLSRFPELRALVTGREVALETLLALGGDVVAAIIAAGTGSPGDEAAEAAVDNLTLEEQADLLIEIIRMTMPNGVGPFVEKLMAMGVSGGDRSASVMRALKSQKPSKD
jgi:hypothetical protein